MRFYRKLILEGGVEKGIKVDIFESLICLLRGLASSSSGNTSRGVSRGVEISNLSGLITSILAPSKGWVVSPLWGSSWYSGASFGEFNGIGVNPCLSTDTILKHMILLIFLLKRESNDLNHSHNNFTIV